MSSFLSAAVHGMRYYSVLPMCKFMMGLVPITVVNMGLKQHLHQHPCEHKKYHPTAGCGCNVSNSLYIRSDWKI